MDKYFASKLGIVCYKWFSNDALLSFKVRYTKGNTILACLFIPVLEINFIFVKEIEDVEGMAIFNNQFLYTTYADDTILFLGDGNSVTEDIQIFEHFSIFSGLKPNKSKCEIAGIGVLNGFQMTLCDMECVNPKTNTIKILGIFFSYNRRLENDENYRRKSYRITEIVENATANN